MVFSFSFIVFYLKHADTKTKTYKGKKKSKAVASRVEEAEFNSLREVRRENYAAPGLF